MLKLKRFSEFVYVLQGRALLSSLCGSITAKFAIGQATSFHLRVA